MNGTARSYVVVTDRGTQARSASIKQLAKWATKNCRVEYVVFRVMADGSRRDVGGVRRV